MVRRDWPHLQWWRAVKDNGELEEEQKSLLVEAGYLTVTSDDDKFVIVLLAEHLVDWDKANEAHETDDEPSSEQK